MTPVYVKGTRVNYEPDFETYIKMQEVCDMLDMSTGAVLGRSLSLLHAMLMQDKLPHKWRKQQQKLLDRQAEVLKWDELAE